MKYHLVYKDEYGTTGILGTFDDHSAATSKARTLVTDANFTNSLSEAEQLKNIEAYFVEFGEQQNIDTNHMYIGHRRAGKYWSFVVGDDVEKSFDAASTPVSIYVGSKFTKSQGENIEKRVYLYDEKKRVINTLTNSFLNGKGLYYIQPVL